MIRPLPAQRSHAAGTLVAFFVGASLGFLFLLTDAKGPAPFLAAAIITTAYGVARSPAATRGRRVLRMAALLVVLGAHALWSYELVSFAGELAWSIPAAVWALVILLSAGVVWTHLPRWKRVEVPLVLPVGLIIAACLFGWRREEARIDCDDLLDVSGQPNVRVRIPTTAAQASCRAGAILPIARFPRHLWESPDGAWYVFTTQLRNPEHNPSVPSPGRLTGSICASPVDGAQEPSCVGVGTAQGMAESAPLDRLFVANWGAVLPGGARGGQVYALSRTDPRRVVGRRETNVLSGELFYDPTDDMVGVLSDEAEYMYPLRASTLEPLDPIPTPVIPGDSHYDEARREGVYCFAAGPLRTIGGSAFGAVAFSTGPYRYRALASASEAPWLWFGFSWGCDWDPERRRVYAAIASLGVVHTIDYDTGKIVGTTYTGMGVRSVAYDRARNRLYLGWYLAGRVAALDLATGAIVKEWRAGRFVRTVVLSRDGKRLVVSSNLGVVEIALDG
ncbi:hypothetical protein [Polyangium sp. 6x1]|uniref:YncE family protein n=1 Tax=Polyangium sp. 6x1 TaxID=3042689 RepID=UPI00248282EC|nr:hypothetical protein [Polyangium sp. 6x1]MDI1449543.1 hypothetical protein [Polyangium sp. 6x1]